jgi:hypothetical protein
MFDFSLRSLMICKWSSSGLSRNFLLKEPLSGITLLSAKKSQFYIRSQSYQTFFFVKRIFFSVFCYYAWLFYGLWNIFLCCKHSSLITKIGKRWKTKIGRIFSWSQSQVFLFCCLVFTVKLHLSNRKKVCQD